MSKPDLRTVPIEAVRAYLERKGWTVEHTSHGLGATEQDGSRKPYLRGWIYMNGDSEQLQVPAGPELADYPRRIAEVR